MSQRYNRYITIDSYFAERRGISRNIELDWNLLEIIITIITIELDISNFFLFPCDRQHYEILQNMYYCFVVVKWSFAGFCSATRGHARPRREIRRILSFCAVWSHCNTLSNIVTIPPRRVTLLRLWVFMHFMKRIAPCHRINKNEISLQIYRILNQIPS